MFQKEIVQLCRKVISFILIVNISLGCSFGYAQSPFIEALPKPGAMVLTSEAFAPILIKGLIVYPDQPLDFDFIIDSGHDSSDPVVINEQSQKIAKYFLAAITVPEDQLWVNLSPYEQDRVIDNQLDQTVLGRDMLAQDYFLKQLASSLLYPEETLGKEFWARVHAQAQRQFGTSDIPLDILNKVWIMPDQAEIFEKGNAVYVTKARLKVMLDSDHESVMQKSSMTIMDEKAALVKEVMREIIVPAIEKEINEGKNFTAVRQIYHAMILAKWYRESITDTFLADVYLGKNKVSGITSDEKALKEDMYQRYIAAFKKGVFNYIKEESTTFTDEVVPKKYFAGGIDNFSMRKVPLDRTLNESAISSIGEDYKISLRLNPQFGKSSSSINNVSEKDALEYQKDIKLRFQKLTDDARELFASDSLSNDMYQQRKIADPGRDGIFQVIMFKDMPELKGIYKEIQNNIQKILGPDVPVTQVPLDSIHLTIATESVNIGGNMVSSVDEVFEQVAADVGEIKKFFKVRLVGPRLTPDGSVIMEFEITDPAVLALRRMALKRHDKNMSTPEEQRFDNDIFHSTVAVVTAKDIPRDRMKELYQYIEKYRSSFKPIDVEVRKISVIEGEGVKRTVSRVKDIPLHGSENVEGDDLNAFRVKNATSILQRVREAFSKGNFKDSSKDIDDAMKELFSYIAQNGVDKDSLILSMYYMAKVMKKAVNLSQHLFINGGERTPTQIIILDDESGEVLLPQRGPYKRLFAGKYTVSANGSLTGKESIQEAIKKEFGIVDVDLNRIELLPREFRDQLISYDFYALNDAEEKALQLAVEKMLPDNNDPLNGIAVEYDPTKKSAIVYTLQDGKSQDEVKDIANRLAELSKIPFVYPVFERSKSRLAIYRINPEEKKALSEKAATDRENREKAMAAINKGGFLDTALEDLEDFLTTWDSDQIKFISIDEMFNNFEMSPNVFALDLLLPYLRNKDLWLDKKKEVIPVGSVLLQEMELVGAKGGNLKRLHLLKGFINGLQIPKTAAISTVAFDKYVLGNKAISGLINQISQTDDERQIENIAVQIKARILAIELPESMKKEIEAVFKDLGGSIAVRSSASKVEDVKGFSGSGLGESYLNVTSIETVFQHIKDVWASQYHVGFIAAIKQRKMNILDAKMAVVLQEFIDGQAAGVINTYDKQTMRTMYKIVGNWGLGESVVQGEGQVQDRWVVGLNPRDQYDILEKNIGKKTDIVIPDGDDGTRSIPIDGREEVDLKYSEFVQKRELPSLTDDDVLNLAKKIEQIHTIYIKNNWAEQIDVEYVKDQAGRIFIVQVRPLNMHDGETVEKNEADGIKTGKIEVSIEVVDENAATSIKEIASLQGITAQPGVISAELLVVERGIPSLEESRGKIVIAPNTNNQWNGVFPHFAGVITQQGMEVAHATNNAREMRIPCIVGVANATAELLPHNHEVVTLDTYNRKIYFGKVPTTFIRISNDIWADSEALALTRGQQKPHELKRQFSDSMQDWPAVFKRYFDGNLRMRSAVYSTFQIDYYYAAWDRLTMYLNNKYKDRRPFELKTQKRVFRDGRLFNQVVDDDQSTIFYFLAGLKDLTIEDLWGLYNDRLQGLERFEQYFAGLKEINSGNIRDVMDQLVEGFMWMHIAYWLGAVDHELFITRQTMYVDPLALPALQAAAVGKLNPKYLLNISRDRDIEVVTVLEMLRRDPKLKTLQNAADVKVFSEHVEENAPGLHHRIVSWSSQYKRDKEHIDLLDETQSYYQLLFTMFQQQSVSSNQDVDWESFLSAIRMVFRTKNIDPEKDLSSIKNTNPDIYYFISSFVRKMLVKELEKPPEYSVWSMNNQSVEEIDKRIEKVIPEILSRIREQERKEKELLPRLEPYPNLILALQLDKVERTLREDGHHIAVRVQRILAREMLKAAEKMPFISNPNDIFQYGIEELVEIFKTGGDEQWIAKSVQWRKDIQEADNYLWRVWDKLSKNLENSRDTVFLLQAPYQRYLVSVYKAIQTINKQMKSATTPELRAWYASEIDRLKNRVADTKYIIDKMIFFESLSFQEKKQRVVKEIERADERLDNVINDRDDSFSNIFQKGIEGNMRREGSEMVAFFPTKGILGIDAMVAKVTSIARKTLALEDGVVSNSIFIPALDAFIQLAFYERSAGKLRSNFDDVAGLLSENAAAMSPFVIKLIGPRLMDDGYIILEYEVMSPEIDVLRTLIKSDLELLKKRAIEAISVPIANDRIKQSVKQLSAQERMELEQRAFSEVRDKFDDFNAGIPDLYHSTIAVLKDRSITKEHLHELRRLFKEIRDDLAFQQPQYYLIDTLVLGEADVKSRKLLHFKQMSLAVKDDLGLSLDERVSSQVVGGIDFKNIDLILQGKKRIANFDSRAVRYLYEMGFDGFAPIIINVTPINNVLPILGLSETMNMEDGYYKMSNLN